MASVTQTIPNYLGGISKQTDYKKLPGQVKECLNAYPDPTFGLTKRPGFKWEKELASGSLTNAKWFYIHRDGAEQYIGRISSGSPGDIAIWNAVSGVACSISYTGSAQAYLNTTKDNYDLLTVQDTTIVTNKTKVAVESAATAVVANKATVVLKRVEYGSRYRLKVDGNLTADYVTINEDAWTEGSGSNVQLLSSWAILDQLKTNILAINSSLTGTLTVTQLTNSLELEYKDGSGNPLAFPSFEAIDDSGNTRLAYFQATVNTIADLPSESLNGRVVEIINSGSASYYSKFLTISGTSGPGYWEETVKEGVSTGLDPSTLPHELFNNAQNSFVFKEATWIGRLAGDAVKSNTAPSFVGNTIQQTFLHNNRLGLLTEDNVVMSQSGDFYNFYFTSALTSTDADPIDISCSSIRPALLHGIVPTAQGLILFSKNQQFMMYSDDGAITPSTAIIRGISNYEMDTNIDPIDVGTNINFVSKTASYSRVFGMTTKGYEENPIVQDISRVVSEWIPSDVDAIFSSPQNDLTGLYGSNTDRIYMYRVYNVGTDNMMQAWFNWKLPGNVQHCVIDNDVVWIVVEIGSKYHLLKGYISKSTSDSVIQTSSGQQVNPHMDFYTTPVDQNAVTYTNDETRINLPFDDISDLTPVLLIAGNGTTNFSGVTESGFTITPTRGTANGTPYFAVENKDLSLGSGTTYDDIYIGYKYNYDVELPKTFFNVSSEGNRSDYTAMLTVARMKFAVGLSSDIAFKIKRKGYIGPMSEYEGDGSTTVFKVPFPLKSENGVRVTLDGAVETNYTVVDVDTHGGGTVTFGTPPTAASTTANLTTPAQKIKITTDTWYDSQPSKEAGEYLSDDVPLQEESIYTVPIHQRTNNFDIRVFSNSPFPVSLNSMMWEGNYSPRFYRRN